MFRGPHVRTNVHLSTISAISSTASGQKAGGRDIIAHSAAIKLPSEPIRDIGCIVMPLRSQNAVRVEIPSGTSKEQYHEFVTHLCSLPSGEELKSRIPFFKSLKLKTSSTAIPTAGSFHGETSDQASPQEDTSLLSAIEWRRVTFAGQSGYPVGTISFDSKESKEAAIRRHRKDKSSPWNWWKLTDKFDYLTVLYDAGTETEVE